MIAIQSSTRYHIFILRIWQEVSLPDPVWRVSLQDPHSAERIGFHDIEALVTFLTQITTKEPDDAV